MTAESVAWVCIVVWFPIQLFLILDLLGPQIHASFDELRRDRLQAPNDEGKVVRLCWTTEEENRRLIVGTEMVHQVDSNDPDVMGECQIDSDPE